MIKIGLLSDTHCFLHPRIFHFFESCDEIWHAGDIGNMETAEKLSSFKPLRAVYGNIDGTDVRRAYPSFQLFTVGQVKVLMMHIGGHPKKYEKAAKELIKCYRPKLFISGHSHILKVIYDKEFDMLHINPGAAGNYGWQKVRTLIEFVIDEDRIKDLKIIELENNNVGSKTESL